MKLTDWGKGSVPGLATFGGSVVKSYKYDAFGNIKYQDGPTVNRGFTYTSRERHARFEKLGTDSLSLFSRRNQI
jgi:hypothetical protein